MGDFTERQVRLREIAAGVGLSSPSSVLYQLERLEAVGAVQRRGEARRRAWLTC